MHASTPFRFQRPHAKLSDKQHTVKRNWQQRFRKKDVPLSKEENTTSRALIATTVPIHRGLILNCHSKGCQSRGEGRNQNVNPCFDHFWAAHSSSNLLIFPFPGELRHQLERGLKFNQSNYYDPFWNVGAENSNMCIVTSSLATAHRTKLLIGFACRALFSLWWSFEKSTWKIGGFPLFDAHQ